MARFLLSIVFAFVATAFAAPGQPDTSKCVAGDVTPDCCPDCFGTLPSLYTLTAVKIGDDGCADPTYYGLKVESFYLFQDQIASYCPFTGDQASLCPNGTDMALSGSLHPLSLVPGGQDMYVNADGLISITVQHSHSFPPDSYPYYEGWTWTPYQIWPQPPNAFSQSQCNTTDTKYNCDMPTGFWNFKAPNATVGGLMACPNEFDSSSVSVYAITPAFNQTDCVTLDGLGTHLYTGPNPPVWAYY